MRNTVVNRHWIIETDYFLSHGHEAFLLDSSKYIDVEIKYADWTEDELRDIANIMPYPADVFWSSQYMWTKEFYAKNGALPTTSSSDAMTKALARWIINMRNKKSVTPKQAALMDAITPDWKRTKADEWDEKLRWAKAWIASNGGCFPKSTDTGEGQLVRRWLDGQRRVSSRMTAGRKAIIDREIPDWDTGDGDRWLITLQKVVDFYNTHNKAPRKSCEDKEECRLGDFLWRARRDYKADNLGTDRAEMLSANVPGWSAGFGDKWHESLQEYVAFIAKNGRTPKIGDQGTHGSLDTWMRTQRENFGTCLEQDRIDLLDALVPRWNECAEDKWSRLLNEFALYVNTHNEFPSETAKDPAVKELAVWRQIQKKDMRKPDARQDRKAALDAALPHWEDSWEFKLHKVSACAQTLGRIPSTKNPDKVLAAMGLWAARQRRDRGKLTSHQIAELNRVLPAWDSVR